MNLFYLFIFLFALQNKKYMIKSIWDLLEKLITLSFIENLNEISKFSYLYKSTSHN